MYEYICICVYMPTCVELCMCIHVCIHVCVHTCMYTCVCVLVCVYVSVCFKASPKSVTCVSPRLGVVGGLGTGWRLPCSYHMS